nr:hypothetical protein TSUD_348810 [Ipomoea batatas]GMD38121.1 hypothetical protein TSUD_348810 [Ipomoea batatas]
MERLVFKLVPSSMYRVAMASGGQILSVEEGGGSATVTGFDGVVIFLDPLCRCIPQYLCPGTEALLHRHFLPSDLKHLSGSVSANLF